MQIQLLLLQIAVPTAAGRSQCAHAPPYPNCKADYARQHDYSVRVLERDPYNGKPLVSYANGDSSYEYNFNGPWFPPPLGSGAADGLIVRVQENWRLPNATHPEWTDTGALTAVRADTQKGTADHINASLVFWPGTAAPPHQDHNHICVKPHPYCSWGAIDPRIAFRPETEEYYLTWDNCTFECAYRSSMLSISKVRTWVRPQHLTALWAHCSVRTCVRTLPTTQTFRFFTLTLYIHIYKYSKYTPRTRSTTGAGIWLGQSYQKCRPPVSPCSSAMTCPERNILPLSRITIA